MGYDLTNFVEKVDDELQCQICTLVLEHPVETPCEHFFCSECIECWLSVNAACPVDRHPLTTADLRHPNRLIRNLLGKLDIRCDFHVDGCLEIVKLDNLKNHLSSCIYRSDEKVTCDKGCNLEITRREYKENNCYVHLKNKVSCQQKEIIELMDQVRLQSNEKKNAENVVSGVREEIAKLNDEVMQLRNNMVAGLPSAFAQFDKLRIFFMHPPRWHKNVNMKIQSDGPIMMEKNDKSKFSLAQSAVSLNPMNSYFKIHILKCASNLTTIGLRPFGEPSGYRYRSDGKTAFNNEFRNTTEMWEEGDVITCGIIFRNHQALPSLSSVIYFRRNESEITRYSINLPSGGLFPTVYMQR